jgi:hypothetical protein
MRATFRVVDTLTMASMLPGVMVSIPKFERRRVGENPGRKSNMLRVAPRASHNAQAGGRLTLADTRRTPD